MSESESMSTLTGALASYATGAPPPAPAPAPAAPDPVPPATPPAEPAPAEPSAAPPEPTPEKTPEQIFNENPKNAAFAQMRTQNARFISALGKIGQLIGIDNVKDPDELISVLEQRLIASEAQKNNVPVELYQQLEQARQDALSKEREMLKQAAAIGFQKVMSSFNLSQAQLQEFAQQLYDAGKNPYMTAIDLMQEYRALNFDKILAQERDRAVQAALANQRKTQEHSSAPSSLSGKPAEPPTQVTSVADLTQLLNRSGLK